MNRTWALVALSAALAGCGGGSSSPAPIQVNPAPAPSPAPSPTPSPTPTPTPSPPSTIIGLTQPGAFATLASAFRFTTRRDGSDPRGSTEPDPAAAIDLAYVAADNAYEMRLPGVSPARIVPDFDAREFTAVHLPWPGASPVGITLYKPGAANRELQLFHTSLGYWSATRADPADPDRFELNYGDFVYGVPTLASDLPAAGQSDYTGIIYGGGVGFLTGDVRLGVDFAARQLTGEITLRVNDGIGGVATSGVYRLTPTRIDSGSASFSGTFATSDGSATQGVFEGRFTGPRGEELMVRWRGTFFDPHNGRNARFAGIWVAKQRP
jgi:hypothetical protein